MSTAAEAAAATVREHLNRFGHTKAPEGGVDFTPIVKYDSRSGRMFRIDRVNKGNGFESEQIDITTSFKAICDFENIETGWIDITPGAPPRFSMVLLKKADSEGIPPKPDGRSKNGVRFMLKLSKECGGDRPVREIAGNAKVFVAGIESIFDTYEKEVEQHPGHLPVLALERTIPIKTGQGEKTSTNYQPIFKIRSWVQRPDDLTYTAKTTTTSVAPSSTPPSTGSTKVPPPNAAQSADDDDDFG